MSIPGRLLQSVVNAGELAPRLRDRSDLQAYFSGADILENLVSLREGGAIRRSGTRYVATLGATAQLKTFKRSSETAAVIVLQDQALSIYDAQSFSAVVDGQSPLSVVTPWPEADLGGLTVWQSVDVMFFAHRSAQYQPRVLLRQSETSWSMAVHDNEAGPFLEQNLDDAFTVTPSGTSGTITLTASSAFFDASQVGGLVRFLEGPEQADYSIWEPGESVSTASVRSYESNVYQSGSDAACGTRPPVHLSGTVRDGHNGAFWTFLHSKAGLVQITNVSSSTSATASVIDRLPDSQAGKGFSYIAEGAFSNLRGWPRTGVIFEERLWYFGTKHQPDTLFASRTKGYGPSGADFTPGAGDGTVLDTDGIVRTFADAQINPPAWVVAREALYVGTPTGVKRVSGPYTDEPITPAGTISRQINLEPVHPDVDAVMVGGPDRLLYPSLGGERLIEMAFDGQTDDLTARAEHVFASPCAQLVWAGEPHRRLYARRADGQLRVLTYDRKQGVVGWSRITLGGSYENGPPRVESLAVAPDANGRDRLWMVVLRTVNGAEVFSLEVLEPDWRSERALLDEAVFVDAAVRVDRWNANPAYTVKIVATEAARGETVTLAAVGHTPFDAGTVGQVLRLRRVSRPGALDDAPGDVTLTVLTASGASATARLDTDPAPGHLNVDLKDWAFVSASVSGLDHLEGEAVTVFADGVEQGVFTVTGGAVTALDPFARAAVGLAYPWRCRSMSLVSGTPLGTTTGSPIRVERMHVGFVDALEAELRVIIDGEARQAEPLAMRSQDDRLGQAPEVKTGRADAPVNGGFGSDVQIEVFGAAPYPFTLTSITAEVRLGS